MTTREQKFRLAPVATLFGALCFGLALADDGKQTKSQKSRTAQEAQATSQEKPAYTPPRRGAPRTRVGGGTRSGGDQAVVLQVLAPEHTGLTMQTQPTLYWYASRAIDGNVEFVLTERDAVTPAWRQHIDGGIEAGIQAFSLKNAGLELATGVTYQWSVAVTHRSGQRARDVVAIGTVERIADAPLAGTPLANPSADPTDQAAALAANGIWYDAIQILCESIHAGTRQESDSVAMRRYRHDLLEQVGLLDVAYAEAVVANY